MEGMVGQVPTADESAKLPVGNWGAFGAFGVLSDESAISLGE